MNQKPKQRIKTVPKIFYFISSLDHGRGGHFHSLNSTASALGRLNSLVINIGLKPSPTIASSTTRSVFIYFNGLNIFFVFKKIISLVKKESPDIFHSFDASSHFFARSFGFVFNKPVFHTKCGGPNPKKYYPYATNLILYSQENEKHFKNHNKHCTSTIHFIPNRISPISQDINRIQALRQHVCSNGLVFLRIGRISKAYENTIMQSINLVNDLNLASTSRNILIIIGAIQDKDIYDKIASKNSSDVYFITDDYFTENANQLVDVADIVIGTGRGLMEAAFLEKVLLVPNAGSRYPVFLTNGNFTDLFEKNFSPRGKVESSDDLSDILNIINNDDALNKCRQFSKNCYTTFFSIDEKIEEFIKLYTTATPSYALKPIDYLSNWIYCEIIFLRKYLSYRRNNA